MDDALPILDYLPNSFRNPSEAEYIAFLWGAFECNYQNGKYQFAMLACHMLYMSFVYFSLWQLKCSRAADFSKSLVGFSKDEEKTLLSMNSPFIYSSINEARIFRFLKLIGCDNNHIGPFAKLVDERNKIAHSNGTILSNQSVADQKIAEILRQMATIQTYMQPVLQDCLRDFLHQSHNPDEREYTDATDQIRELLIHANYFSQEDIKACLAFDINTLSDNQNFAAIKTLFNTFTTEYSSTD